MRAPLRAVTNEAHAAGPHAPKQDDDYDSRTLADWRRRWRAFMGGAVLYFDEIPREYVQSYRPYLQPMGSVIQPFFDSNVTHVISDRPVSDVAAKARAKGMKVYTNEKLARFMGSLTGYTMPRITAQGHNTQLNQLLENEQRQKTVNAAYAHKESNFHTFRGPYILVFDPQHVNRPMAIKEWRPAEPDEGAWPQLRLNPRGMSPFTLRASSKASKRRHNEGEKAAALEEYPKRRALMGPTAQGLAGLGLTESAAPVQRRAINPLMPDAPVPAQGAPAQLNHPAEPAPQRSIMAAEPAEAAAAGGPLGGLVGPNGAAAASAATDANVEDLALAGASAPGPGEAAISGETGPSGPKHNVRDCIKHHQQVPLRAQDLEQAPEQPQLRAQPHMAQFEPAQVKPAQELPVMEQQTTDLWAQPQPQSHDLRAENGDAEKENQLPWTAPRAGPTPSMQPFSQSHLTQPTQASARLREFGEIVASGVQRYSQTSTKSFAANVGPSREVADLKRKVLPPAGPSRPRAEPTKRDKPTKKPGFCENCLERYEDLGEHLRGQSHVMFATNEKKFAPLNEALQRFEHNRHRRRLQS